MYRIEHLSYASNTEASFEGWLQQPWHILYSSLRCMACQEWHRQHVCPICCNTDRNIGGTHNAWAYFDGCITHLTPHQSALGHFLTHDPPSGHGRPMIPSVASLLAELYPNKGVREWLPMLTITYMAPGGHRQWPMSISALLDRLSWLVMQTRILALSTFQAAVERNQVEVGQRSQWLHQHHSSSLISGLRWVATRLGITFPRERTRPTSFILNLWVMEFHMPILFMP